MTTQLIKCNCKSEFQDEKYGYGVRVGNCTAQSQYRCTVCGTVSGTKTVATAKAPVVAATTAAEPAKTSPTKKKSGGNSGGKDIKKEKPGKKSLKGTKR